MKILYILTFMLLLGVNSTNAQFAASNFSLASNIDPVGGAGIKYSACWGWTQPGTGREYAIACSKDGTYWIDVTDPFTPTVAAYQAGTSTGGSWREVKTYSTYCYVVSDDGGSTGFQVFDMSTLPATVTLVSSNQTLFRRGHACTVDGNKLYVSGVTYSAGAVPASSAMDLYSLATPSAPVLLRRLSQDYPAIGYVHDEHVRNDTIFASCGNQGLYVFKYNSIGNTFTQLGSLTSYTMSGYNHFSAWTPNGQTLVMADEVPAQLPLKIVDVSNIANMTVTAITNQFPQSTPHNPWVVNNQYCFLSSYMDGTQLFDISSPATPSLVGYFDTYPAGGGNNNNWAPSAYNGQWGLYPYFPSRNIFALDRTNGVFMLRTHLYAKGEINVIGNANSIPDGAAITSPTNSTNYGTVNAGSNLTHAFIVQNTGLGPLTVSSINITGANASEFTIIGGPAVPFTLAPNGALALSIQFAPLTNGTRSAQVTINNDDVNEASYDFVVDGNGNGTVGMKNSRRNNFNISLFPDPAQNELQFTIPFYLASKDLVVKVYSIEGKLVAEKTRNDIAKGGNLVRTINVNELNNGLYYFNLFSNGQNVGTKKFIVSK